MIMTRGIIVELPPEGSNIFRVEIPLMGDNTTNEAIFNATLCESPGSYNGFEVGDVVIVHFLDHEMNDAIIMGKLFTSIPEEDKAFILANRLKVTNSVELPSDTRINGLNLGDLTQGVINAGNAIGGGGSLNPDDLRDYVKYVPTERGNDSYLADRIRTMSGEEYDELVINPDLEVDEFNNTLYFLTSPATNVSALSMLGKSSNNEGD